MIGVSKMVEMLESLALDETSVLLWTPQQDQRWTIAPDGDVNLAVLAHEAYLLSGQLILGSETLTFNRADELAEMFMMFYRLRFRELTAFLQLDSHTNVFVIIDSPFVKKYVGSNVAVVEMLCRIVGTVADYQDGYFMDDLEIVSNDWNI